jgi:protein arginine kinase activator
VIDHEIIVKSEKMKNMLCQNCHKNIATVHLTKIMNNEKTQTDLCQQCAMQQNWLNISLPMEVSNFLGGFIKFHSEQGSPSVETAGICKKCGMSFGEFLQTGKMGCENCYEQFGARITPLIKRMHRNINHTGKIPGKLFKDMAAEKKVDILEKELQTAVKNEEYEKAAVLRDKIKAVRNGSNEGKGRKKDVEQG